MNTSDALARVSLLEKRIAEMDRLHRECMDASCTCYSDVDGVCVHCNRSIALSEQAEKTQEEADERDAANEAKIAALVKALENLVAEDELLPKQERPGSLGEAHAALALART